MAEYRPEREKRPPCPVSAILPVFPYPGDILPSRRVDDFFLVLILARLLLPYNRDDLRNSSPFLRNYHVLFSVREFWQKFQHQCEAQCFSFLPLASTSLLTTPQCIVGICFLCVFLPPPLLLLLSPCEHSRLKAKCFPCITVHSHLLYIHNKGRERRCEKALERWQKNVNFAKLQLSG